MNVLRSLTVLTLAVTLGRPLQAGEIRIDSALVTLIESVEVPALEEGALAELKVVQGATVNEGAVLARLQTRETENLLLQTELQHEIAAKQSNLTLEIAAAKEELRVVQADLHRARQSQQRFPTSVSQSEIEHLELQVSKAEANIHRVQQEGAIALLTEQLRLREIEFARLQLDRRLIKAPLQGVVVEILRSAGEWVHPGDTVLRIIRLDRLRAEGFVDTRHLAGDLSGRSARLDVTMFDGQPKSFQGRVVFVSPEIDPVNRQVRIWAEIDNPSGSLQPGQTGTMTID